MDVNTLETFWQERKGCLQTNLGLHSSSMFLNGWVQIQRLQLKLLAASWQWGIVYIQVLFVPMFSLTFIFKFFYFQRRWRSFTVYFFARRLRWRVSRYGCENLYTFFAYQRILLWSWHFREDNRHGWAGHINDKYTLCLYEGKLLSLALSVCSA